jgi:hypothetical protein
MTKDIVNQAEVKLLGHKSSYPQDAETITLDNAQEPENGKDEPFVQHKQK